MFNFIKEKAVSVRKIIEEDMEKTKRIEEHKKARQIQAELSSTQYEVLTNVGYFKQLRSIFEKTAVKGTPVGDDEKKVVFEFLAKKPA